MVEDLEIKRDEHRCSLLEEIKFALTKTGVKIRQGKKVSATEKILASGNLTDDLAEELKEEGRSSEKFRLLLDVLAQKLQAMPDPEPVLVDDSPKELYKSRHYLEEERAFKRH